MPENYEADKQAILEKRHALGADYWATPDRRLIKGSPFTTMDCAYMLADLGMEPTHPVLEATAQLIFSTLREDGRFKLSPDGAIYPCHTINAIRTLCYLGYADDPRLEKTWAHLLETQHAGGGWRCNKFPFGRGPETEHANPGPTLAALDAFRFTPDCNRSEALTHAVAFLLDHWNIRVPIGPCHYGIGSRFMQITYPFTGYHIFFYAYVLSFYDVAKQDARFLEALSHVRMALTDGRIVVQRQNPGLKGLAFCAKGKASAIGTARYQEILTNLAAPR